LIISAARCRALRAEKESGNFKYHFVRVRAFEQEQVTEMVSADGHADEREEMIMGIGIGQVGPPGMVVGAKEGSC
jgi:hypothetical protein